MKEDLLKRPELLHRNGKQEYWLDYGRYLSRKLAVLVTAELWLHSRNWQRYESLCRPVLYDPRPLMERFNAIKNKQEAHALQSRLSVVEQWLAEEA
jgi:hypothetical protein